MKLQTSKQFTLNLRDWGKGAIIAVASAVIPVITESLSRGELTFDWNLIGTVALSAFVAYLAKNFFEPTKTVAVATDPYERLILASAVKDPDTPGQPPHPTTNPIHPKRDTKP